MDFTMDFGPYFTVSVLLRWLGFPLLTAAAGFLVYWRMIRSDDLLHFAYVAGGLGVAFSPLSVGIAAFAAADFGRGEGGSLPGGSSGGACCGSAWRCCCFSRCPWRRCGFSMGCSSAFTAASFFKEAWSLSEYRSTYAADYGTMDTAPKGRISDLSGCVSAFAVGNRRTLAVPCIQPEKKEYRISPAVSRRLPSATAELWRKNILQQPLEESLMQPSGVNASHEFLRRIFRRGVPVSGWISPGKGCGRKRKG